MGSVHAKHIQLHLCVGWGACIHALCKKHLGGFGESCAVLLTTCKQLQSIARLGLTAASTHLQRLYGRISLRRELATVANASVHFHSVQAHEAAAGCLTLHMSTSMHSAGLSDVPSLPTPSPTTPSATTQPLRNVPLRYAAINDQSTQTVQVTLRA